jgi:Zinc dependent phospholipase C
MSVGRLALALLGVGLVFSVLPPSAHAWTPGTHIYLGESLLGNLQVLPTAVADLLRSYPFDFLYGNIAADSSIAKHYAPLGRHCHYWHVGQEIHDLAGSDALRAFALGYLCHLSADTVAHNYFVPRQLMLTTSTASVGHSYWEARVESHLGDAYSKAAKDVILLDHGEADAHLDRIIAPTIFSVRTNRRLFRGMVRLTESSSWQLATQMAREYSRWPLEDPDVERHLGLSFDFMVELLRSPGSPALQLDPSGERPLKTAKAIRRRVMRNGGRGRGDRLRSAAQEHYGLPDQPLAFWTTIPSKLPWRAPEGSAPSPRLLVSRDR